MLFRSSFFPIAVSLGNKLCMTCSSPAEILHQEVICWAKPTAVHAAVKLPPDLDWGAFLPEALCSSCSAGNNSAAPSQQLSSKGKRNKCFSSQTSRMSLPLPKTGWRQQDWTLSWAPVWLPRQPRAVPLFRTTPSTVSGTQVWSETASNTEVRYPVSAHRPPSADGITVRGDTTPTAPRGVQVLEQHLPWARWLHLAPQLELRQSFLYIPPPSCRAGPRFSCPVHKHHWPPPVLSSACWKQTPLSAEGQGQCYRSKKVPYLFWRCCGNGCDPAAPMSELHLTLVPTSHLPDEQLPQQCVCDYPYMHIHMPYLFPVTWNYMPQFWEANESKNQSWLENIYENIYIKMKVFQWHDFFSFLNIVWRKGKIIFKNKCFLLQFLDGFPNLYF